MALQGILKDRRSAAIIVFIAALAVRLGYVAASSQGTAELQGDAAEYQSYALNLVESGRYENYQGRKASRMPGYPLFLDAVYSVAGRSVAAVQIVQSLAGAAACVLIYLLALEWFDWRWALAGGLSAAVYFDLVSPCARLTTEALTIFFLTLTYWLWCRKRSLSAAGGVLIGTAAGLAYLLRSEFLLYVPILAACAFLAGIKEGIRRPWHAPAAILLTCALIALPWVLRNERELGRPIATSTAGPVNLYLGIPWTIHDRLGGLQDSFVSVPDQEAKHPMGELEASDYYKRVVPGLYRQASVSQILRAAFFNLLIQYYPFAPAYDATFVFLLPFWLWGLWLCRNDPRRWPLLAAVLYKTSLHAVVAVMQSRHRQVTAAAVVLLALSGLRELWRRWPRDAKSIAIGWASVNAFVWLFSPWFRSLALAFRDLI